jgi:type II secretory pathway pseudopilin PulG
VIEWRQWRLYAGIVALGMVVTGLALGQAEAPAQPQTSGAYKPKFPGDPARSESEAQALGYMRVVLRAQREYKKRHEHYAESLASLAGTASFTKRMAHSTDRGDYTASFRPHRSSDKEGFILAMTPKQINADHRSFYAEEDGVIHGDDQKAADAESPKVK